VICPSNPIVSIGPILAVPGTRQAIEVTRARGVPVVAVSPIVAGKALKGPADRMLVSLGHESSAVGVAGLYRGLVDVFVYDVTDTAVDVGAVEALGMVPIAAETIMTTDERRAALARRLLDVPAILEAAA